MIRWNNVVTAGILTLPLSLFVAYCGANMWQVAAVDMWVFICMHIAAFIADKE
jgi:hypothetical protein